MLRFFTAFAFLFIFSNPDISACGFSFVGDCSTGISLSINGTQDSFAVAYCPGVLKFDGFVLGSLQSLAITRAKAVTWESCQNNVSGMSLRYRVYEQGLPGGVWQSIDLQEDYNTLAGPYTTRYRSATTNTSLTDGLVAGKTYVLEIYFLAEVDTIGDDFIPETTLLENKNGENYRMTFQYGGVSAPPFEVATTKIVDVKCHGDSTGTAGVSVYGDQTGLFFQWSAGNNNFPVLSGIPAGEYSVTVTGVNGYSAVETIEISEPFALNLQFFPVTGLGCDGASGAATAVPEGGIPPYGYHWSDGQQTAAAVFPISGNYAVTVTDANGCSVTSSVAIPAQPVVLSEIKTEICKGETLSIGGQQFSNQGYYEFTLPGNGACDTLIQLTLNVLNPGGAFVSLSDSIVLTCAEPAINLCAVPVANTSYEWSKDGVPAVTSLCILATAGGNYTLVTETTGSAKTCAASKTIASEEHIVPPALESNGTLEYISHCYTADSAIVKLTATTDAAGAAFTWRFNGQIVSTADTCEVIVTVFDFPNLIMPTVSVTDQYGCTAGPVSPSAVGIVQPPLPPFIFLEQEPDLCTKMVDVALFVSGDQPPYSVMWGDSLVLTDTVSFPPGTYNLVVTDGNGCSSAVNVVLYEIIYGWVDHVGPAGGEAWVYVPGDGNYTYLWNTGSTEPGITGLSGGEYCVTVTDEADGCTADTCFTVLVSVREAYENQLNLAPNPAAAGQWVDVRLPLSISDIDLAAEIFDARGKLLSGFTVQYGDAALRCHLPPETVPGLFFVRIRDRSGKTWTGKLVLR